jgi:hypothetical protein
MEPLLLPANDRRAPLAVAVGRLFPSAEESHGDADAARRSLVRLIQQEIPAGALGLMPGRRRSVLLTATSSGPCIVETRCKAPLSAKRWSGNSSRGMRQRPASPASRRTTCGGRAFDRDRGRVETSTRKTASCHPEPRTRVLCALWPTATVSLQIASRWKISRQVRGQTPTNMTRYHTPATQPIQLVKLLKTLSIPTMPARVTVAGLLCPVQKCQTPPS